VERRQADGLDGLAETVGVKSELVEAFHISEDKVRVIVPDTGPYGGKHTGNARRSCAISESRGKPVKLV